MTAATEKVLDGIYNAMQELSIHKEDQMFADLCKNISDFLRSNIATSIDQIIQEKLDNYIIDQVIDGKVDTFMKGYMDEKHRELVPANQPTGNDDEIQADNKDESQADNKDEIQAKINENSTNIKLIEEKIEQNATNLESLKKTLTEFQVETDRKVAVKLQNEESNNSDLKNRVVKLEAKADNTEQYTRRETIEFHRIPSENTYYRREDPTNMIVNFCARHLDIKITRDHISVCHRQIIEADKKRLGKKYIPPIYCRFVNRSLMLLCLERQSWLKNVRNRFGQKIFLKENLTLERRQLWERVKNELHSFRFKWIKDWKIMVRKDEHSKPMRIYSEKVLESLLKDQPAAPDPSTTPRPNSERKPQHSNQPPSNYQSKGSNTFRLGRHSSDWPLPEPPSRHQEFDWFDGQFLTGSFPTRTYETRSFTNSSYGNRPSRSGHNAYY